MSCLALISLLAGPVGLTFHDGGVGTPHRACARSELSFSGGGILIAEPSEFYGNIRLAGTLEGSWALTPELEVFGSLELLRFQTVISSLSASHFGIGHTSLGAALRVLDLDEASFASFTRLTLPTAFGLYENTFPITLEAGLSGTRPLIDSFELHLQLAVLFSFAVSSGPADPRAGLQLTSGVSWIATEWLALVLDLETSLFYRAGLDHFATALGVRLAPLDELGIELAAKVPWAGDERALAAAKLGVSWTF